MNAVQNLVNAALLGSKQPLKMEALPAVVSQEGQNLPKENAEEAFFQLAALGLTYAYAGQCLEKAKTDAWQRFEEAPSIEEKTLSKSVLRELSFLLDTVHRRYLLRDFFETMHAKQRCLPNNALPPALEYWQRHGNFTANPERQQALLGQQGTWLSRMLELDAQTKPEKPEENEDWELGSFSQRKAYLSKMRQINPKLALEELEKIWKSSSAEHRLAYIENQENGLSANDEAFLMAALKDRSSYVKEQARNLLLRIDDSALQKQFLSWLKARLSLELPAQEEHEEKDKKNWLQLSRAWLMKHFGTNDDDDSPKKTKNEARWIIHELPYEPEMKTYGIGEISPYKKERDIDYQLGQLISLLPLSIWPQILGLDERQCCLYLIKNPPLPMYKDLYTLSMAFKETLFKKELAMHIFKNKKVNARNFLSLFHALSTEDREKIFGNGTLKDFSSRDIFSQYSPDSEKWGPNYSVFILKTLISENDLQKPKRYIYVPELELASRIVSCLDLNHSIVKEYIKRLNDAHQQFIQSDKLKEYHYNFDEFARWYEEFFSCLELKESLNAYWNSLD